MASSAIEASAQGSKLVCTMLINADDTYALTESLNALSRFPLLSTLTMLSHAVTASALTESVAALR